MSKTKWEETTVHIEGRAKHPSGHYAWLRFDIFPGRLFTVGPSSVDPIPHGFRTAETATVKLRMPRYNRSLDPDDIRWIDVIKRKTEGDS